MDLLAFGILFVFLIICTILIIESKKLKKLLSEKNSELNSANKKLGIAIAAVEKFKTEFSGVLDAKEEAEKILVRASLAESTATNVGKTIIFNSEKQADSIKQKADDYVKAAKQQIEQKFNSAKSDIELTRQQADNYNRQVRESAEEIIKSARQSAAATSARAKDKLDSAELKLEIAGQQAIKIIADARSQAEIVAGDAYKALQQADQIKASAEAMQNIIDGYGNKYMKPSHSVLDDLAQAYSHMEAGQELKKARERSKLMMDQDRAATCDYVEKNRRETAIRFVLDAFNGKVDSILSRARTENHGTLTQEIKDAAAIVNYNGSAFRNAQINQEYISSRIDELMWAVRVNQLRDQEKEEQRVVKEKIREEERARKEYERALKETAREEELVRKALEKAHAYLAKASDEQRNKYEDQIQQLNQKLKEAEDKSKRAMSMAQQTKTGHVYVISNIGSFGEHVYKIGMTRRLEPLDRVHELGSASVPFGFDVHAMIWSNNAPTLEKTLHRKFVQSQVNKVNPRKEFFKLTIAEIRKELDSMGIETSWTMAAEARDFRETQAIECMIKDNDVNRNEWLRQQIIYEDKIEELEDVS